MTHEQALKNVVDAWNSLSAGGHKSREVQEWMSGAMWHAVNDAREALGIPRSDCGRLMRANK